MYYRRSDSIRFDWVGLFDGGGMDVSRLGRAELGSIMSCPVLTSLETRSIININNTFVSLYTPVPYHLISSHPFHSIHYLPS